MKPATLEQDTKRYFVKVIVEYEYEVEADSREEAEEQGWDYQDYPYNASVYSIHAEELEEDEEV
jgi:hypothetical protein